MKILRLLLVLLLSTPAHAWTTAKGYSDSAAPSIYWFPAAGCINTTPTSKWDIFATDPVAACVTGTVIKKGVLTFDDTNTCTSTTATTGWAFLTFQLPADFPSTGRIDAKVLFTSTGTTNGQTLIWTLSTKCSVPTTSHPPRPSDRRAAAPATAG